MQTEPNTPVTSSFDDRKADLWTSPALKSLQGCKEKKDTHKYSNYQSTARGQTY